MAEATAAPVPRERIGRAERPAPSPTPYVAGSSRLGERAREEYHYVARDLRNIGVLLVVMAALLAAAVVGFNVLGLS